MPDLKELYLFFHDSNHNIDGNPNLKAETSHHIESSVTWKFLKEKYLIQIEPSVFYNIVNDKIALVDSINTSHLTYVNVEKFISKRGAIKNNSVLP